jgi:hypothetical protein
MARFRNGATMSCGRNSRTADSVVASLMSSSTDSWWPRLDSSA